VVRISIPRNPDLFVYGGVWLTHPNWNLCQSKHPRRRTRRSKRNYEIFKLRHLPGVVCVCCTFARIFTKIGSVLNVILLLVLFAQGQITIGVFVSLTNLMFAEIYFNLTSLASFFRISGFHIKTFEAYDKFFALSEDDEEQKQSCQNVLILNLKMSGLNIQEQKNIF